MHAIAWGGGSDRNVQELVLTSCHVGPGGGIWVGSVGSKHLYPKRHLANRVWKS